MAETIAVRATPSTAMLQEASQPRTMPRAWRRFIHQKPALIGMIVLLILGAMGILAPVIAPRDIYRNDLRHRYLPPSAEYWLGTDGNGRDVWGRTVYSIQISLTVGLAATAISTLIGLVLGLIAGYYGGWVDVLLMRFTEIIMSLPALMLMLTAVAIVQHPTIFTVMIVIGLFDWTGKARLIRAQALLIRNLDYVTAARSLGSRSWRIAFVHVLPNALAPLIVAAAFSVSGAILAEAGLSFLGLGTPPPTPSWGNMLNNARSFDLMQNYPWLWIPPGLGILITVLAVNFVGDGLREALDPLGNKY